jgi:hypothetical protein
MKRYKRIALLTFIFAVCLMVYSGEQWLSIDKVYQEANDAYADFSKIVRKVPAYDSADPLKDGDAAAYNVQQGAMYAVVTSTASLHVGEGATAALTQAWENNSQQYAPTPESPDGTSPSQDAVMQGDDQLIIDPLSTATNFALSPSPTPTPTATAVIAAP